MERYAGLLVYVVERGVTVCKSPGVALRSRAVSGREPARYES